MNLIEVVAVSEQKNDKNGRPYNTVTFKELPKTVNINGRQVTVKSNNPTRVRNVWGPGANSDGVEIKGDALYGNLAVGDIVEGSFHTFATTDYEINDRVVNQFSCVVFNNEDAVSFANRQLQSKNASVINTEAAHIVPAGQPANF